MLPGFTQYRKGLNGQKTNEKAQKRLKIFVIDGTNRHFFFSKTNYTFAFKKKC